MDNEAFTARLNIPEVTASAARRAGLGNLEARTRLNIPEVTASAAVQL